MFVDDTTSLNTSDKDTDTVQKELQRSINEASDWCDYNAKILHLAIKYIKKDTTCYLNLSLNDTHFEQVHEHRPLGVITDDELSWRPHITGTCKTVSNKSLSIVTDSDTLWILLSAISYSTMLTFPLT